jgi:hypothetical protein
MTPEQRTLRARTAAHAQHAQGRTNTQPARDAWHKRFLDQVDPDRVLPEAERLKRAEHAKKAHMSRMALASSRARARNRAAPSTVDGEAATTSAARAANEIHPCPGCGRSTRAVDLCQNCRTPHEAA